MNQSTFKKELQLYAAALLVSVEISFVQLKNSEDLQFHFLAFLAQSLLYNLISFHELKKIQIASGKYF